MSLTPPERAAINPNHPVDKAAYYLLMAHATKIDSTIDDLRAEKQARETEARETEARLLGDDIAYLDEQRRALRTSMRYLKSQKPQENMQ